MNCPLGFYQKSHLVNFWPDFSVVVKYLYMPFILVFSSLGANILNGGWHDCRLQISVNELTVIIDEKAIQLTHSTLPAHFGRYIYFGQR